MDQAQQVTPQSVVNYDLFQFKAVVDWIQIEFTTAAPTNFGAIRRNCGLDYVKALNPDLGSAATIFCARIQDPPRWHDVAAKIAAIEARFPFVTPATVTAIEVSFDAYGKGASADELAEQACRFFKFQTRPVDKNRRFSGRWKGDVEGLRHYDRVRRMVRGGRVIAIGNKTDDRTQRVYFKTTDKAGKVALPESQWRARIELTLQGQCLPASNGIEWSSCKFEQLYEFFNFTLFHLVARMA